MLTCVVVSAASDILARVRSAGLADAVAEQFERALLPGLDEFLATVPPQPPARGPDEDAMHQAFVTLVAPAGELLQAPSSVLDALAQLVEENLRRDAADGAVEQRALSHLADALDSLTRITAATVAVLRESPVRALTVTQGYLADLDEDARRCLRGIVAVVVALSRFGAPTEVFAPWTWLARRSLLASEGVVLLRLAQAERAKAPEFAPRRIPGAGKGIIRIAADFDDPLPAEIEALFYGEQKRDEMIWT